jgi:hypothetical protein
LGIKDLRIAETCGGSDNLRVVGHGDVSARRGGVDGRVNDAKLTVTVTEEGRTDILNLNGERLEVIVEGARRGGIDIENID